MLNCTDMEQCYLVWRPPEFKVLLTNNILTRGISGLIEEFLSFPTVLILGPMNLGYGETALYIVAELEHTLYPGGHYLSLIRCSYPVGAITGFSKNYCTMLSYHCFRMMGNTRRPANCINTNCPLVRSKGVWNTIMVNNMEVAVWWGFTWRTNVVIVCAQLQN